MAAKKSSKTLQKTNRKINISSLNRFIAVSAVSYAILATVAYLLMSRTTEPISVGYLTKDELASKTNTIIAPASHGLFDIQLRWLLIGGLLVWVIINILYLTLWQNGYKAALKKKVVAMRWIDLGISGALIMETLALLSGVQEITTLKLIGGLISITALLGWIAEKRNSQAGRPVWSEFLTGLSAAGLVWVVIASYAVNTATYGLVRSPGYVYGLYISMLTGFVLLAINQYNQHRRFGNWQNYTTVERNYLLINAATKIVFAAILIFGLRT